jgi:photosystem II stability/assembly factor-like uncharacterized protein
MKRSILAIISGLTALLAVVTAPSLALASEVLPVHQLKQDTHIHGLAADRVNANHLLIATHHGVFRAGPDGMAERISPVKDFMGFTPHPSDPETFYGSGHPAGGGNLGFIVSSDGGATWQQRSPGADGPVDFHQMTVSPVDPDIIYGTYGTLQRSADGGHSWSIVGPLPSDLISLAASARAVDTLYAGTRNGLQISRDGGQNWQTALSGFAVSLVAADGDGGLFAFVPGHGLVRADEDVLDFSTLSQGWEDQVLLHMAFDPDEPRRIFAASHHSDVFASEDGGVTWSPMKGPEN